MSIPAAKDATGTNGEKVQVIEQEIQKIYPNGVPPQATTGRQLR